MEEVIRRVAELMTINNQTVDIYTSHSATFKAKFANPPIDSFGLVHYTFQFDNTTVNARTSICEVVALRIPDNLNPEVVLPQPSSPDVCSCCEKTWRDYFNSFSPLPTQSRFTIYIPSTFMVDTTTGLSAGVDIQLANLRQVGLGTILVDGKIGGTGSTNRFILSTCQLEKVIDTQEPVL
jgi:hypothetical protein